MICSSSTSSPVAFICGDRQARPPKSASAVQHIIRDIFTAQSFISIGIVLQAASSYFLSYPYCFLPGALILLASSFPSILSLLGLKKESDESTRLIGRTAAYLDFADSVHAGKPPGSAVAAPSSPPKRGPTKLAIMLIGSRCKSRLGPLQPEFKEMGDVIAGMIREMRTAPPEDDTGFLNDEFYVHSAHPSNNSNMACLYFRSYAHIIDFAHKAGGAHWASWNKFRKLQREKQALGTEIGLWHEIYEVSNAEGIYINMPRMGLGDMWDAVRAPNGQFVYRNSLVSATASYTMSEGRMGFPTERQAPTGVEKT